MMCFGQNACETTHQSTMTQGIQNHQCLEAPHFKALDLLKRLACKDDLLQHHCNENQHLKMLMNQREAHHHPMEGTMTNNACTQHAVKDQTGNAHVSYQEHKRKDEELRDKTSEIEKLKDERRKDEAIMNEISEDYRRTIAAMCQIRDDHVTLNEEKKVLEQKCTDIKRKMELNCVSCEEKMRFFYNMTQELKKHIEDKEVERKQVKKFLIEKLGMEKKKCYQQNEHLKEIMMRNESILHENNKLHFEISEKNNEMRNEKDELVIENNAWRSKAAELSSDLETANRNAKEAEKEASLMKKKNENFEHKVMEKEKKMEVLNSSIVKLKLEMQRFKDQKTEEKDEHSNASTKKEDEPNEDDEADQAETDGFDAGATFKTHVQGILTLVDKMMKTERIERETVILIRKRKKTLDDVKCYEEAVLEDKVERAMRNACRTFKRLMSFENMLVELMAVASAPKKEKKVITMCHEALVDQLRDEMDENKGKNIRSFNSNRSYHGHRCK